MDMSHAVSFGRRAPSIEGCAADLAEAAADVGTAFASAFRQLEDVRSSASDLARHVEGLLRDTSPDAERGEDDPGSLDQFLSHVGRAADAAEAAVGLLADGGFGQALSSVAGCLDEIRRCAFELTAISSLTKVAHTEIVAGTDRLIAFAETLDARQEELRSLSTTSLVLIKWIWRESGVAGHELGRMERTFRGISSDGDVQRVELGALERAHRDRMESVRTGGARLGEDVKGATSRLISCLQFPDAFAQRSDHAGRALAVLAEDRPEAERSAIATVVAAQIDAMAGDLGRVGGASIEALRGIIEALARDACVYGKVAGVDPSGAWMEASARNDATMLRTVETANEQLTAALGLVAGLIERLETAQRGLEVSQGLNRDLEISAHNASVVASRYGSRNSPLHVLAGGVHGVVERTSRLIDTVVRSLERIREVSSELERSSLKEELRRLTDIQRDLAGSTAATARRVDEIGRTQAALEDSAERLRRAATAGADDFATAISHEARLRGIVARVRSVATVSFEGPAIDLTWLEALYTMNDERDVHRSVLGIPDDLEEPGGPDPDAGADDGDLDDFVL